MLVKIIIRLAYNLNNIVHKTWIQVIKVS